MHTEKKRTKHTESLVMISTNKDLSELYQRPSKQNSETKKKMLNTSKVTNDLASQKVRKLKAKRPWEFKTAGAIIQDVASNFILNQNKLITYVCL